MATAGLDVAAAADAAVARREVLLAQMALHVQNQAAAATMATPRQPSTDRALATRKPMSSAPGPHHVVPTAAGEAMRSIADSLRRETVRIIEAYHHVAVGAAAASAAATAGSVLYGGAGGSGEAGTGGSWDTFPRALSSVGGTHRSSVASPLIAKTAQLRQYLRKMAGDTAFLARLPPALVSASAFCLHGGAAAHVLRSDSTMACSRTRRV